MKIKFIMGLVLVLFVSLFVASCNNDDEESLEQEFAHVLDCLFVHMVDSLKCK